MIARYSAYRAVSRILWLTLMEQTHSYLKLLAGLNDLADVADRKSIAWLDVKLPTDRRRRCAQSLLIVLEKMFKPS
jgi:hypothetical protein